MKASKFIELMKRRNSLVSITEIKQEIIKKEEIIEEISVIIVEQEKEEVINVLEEEKEEESVEPTSINIDSPVQQVKLNKKKIA